MWWQRFQRFSSAMFSLFQVHGTMSLTKTRKYAYSGCIHMSTPQTCHIHVSMRRSSQAIRGTPLSWQSAVSWGWCCERELPSSSGTACRRPSPRGNMCQLGILHRYPQRPQIEPEKSCRRHMRGTCLDSKRPLETSRCQHGTHDTDQRRQRPRWLHIYLHCMPHTAKCSPPAR